MSTYQIKPRTHSSACPPGLSVISTWETWAPAVYEPFTLAWPVFFLIQIMAHAFLQTCLLSLLLSLSPASSSKSHVTAPVPTEIFLLSMPTNPVKSTHNLTLHLIIHEEAFWASLASNTHFLKNDQLSSLIALVCPFILSKITLGSL